MKRQLLILSLTPAIISIAGKLILFYSGNQFNNQAALYSGILWIVALFSSIFFAIKHVKYHQYNGYLNLKQAMKAGLQVTIVSALVIGIFTYFFLEYVNTDYISESLLQAQKDMEARKIAAEEIEKNINVLKENVLNPFRLAISGIGITAIAGAFMSFISSTFLLKGSPEN